MIQETQLRTADGLNLYAWLRTPATTLRGVVAHVHGMGEHSRRYDHLTAYWAQQGYASAGFDLRGHGRSEGPRGHTPSYDHLMNDTALFLDRVTREWAGLPVTLYGHSMGGSLVLNYVIGRQPALARVVASAPYLRLAFQPPAWKVRLAQWLRWIVPTLSQKTGLDVNALSQDPAVIARYLADPLVHDRITVSFFACVHEAGEAAIGRASELTIPALVMHGSADRLTSPGGSADFVKNAAGKAVLKIWDGFYHELHNEPGWEAVAAFALAWSEGVSQGCATGKWRSHGMPRQSRKS